MHTISKSQYVKGKQCPKALWLFRNRKDLRPEITPQQQALFDTGNEIGELAKQYFDLKSIEVEAPYWKVAEAVSLTQDYIDTGYRIIFEATAAHRDTGAYSKIDILKVNLDKSVDLFEVKSSTSVKDYHYDDMSLQYYAFKGAGYNIRNCYMMVVNNEYIREGEIDPKKIFKLHDITEETLAKQDEVKASVKPLIEALASDNEPEIENGLHCLKPFECDYKEYCWDNIPQYSIIELLGSKKGFEVGKKTGSFDILDLHEGESPNGNKLVDYKAYISGDTHINKDELRSFVSKLEYPLYYLDYETFGEAIPPFNSSRPYQQIPFQFSLHIQYEEGGKLEHIEFLHQKKTDPRPYFAKALVDALGTQGRIIVYNQSFEQSRNNELAKFLPEYADAIDNINLRMLDLAEPFRKRYLYHPNQEGSYSIKKVLPSFTKLSYSDMEIANGADAMACFSNFIKGKLADNDFEASIPDLLEYCKLDTYAMVELLSKIKEIS